MTANGVHISVAREVNENDLGQIALLIERVVEADGVRPLSDHAMLHLMSGQPVGSTDDQRHVLARRGDLLVGYGHLDLGDLVEGPSAQLAVDSSARQEGIGGRILDRILSEARGKQIQLWAHGDRDAAGQLAQSRDFTVLRRLLRMKRSLRDSLPAPRLARGFSVRSFDAEIDIDEWLKLNSRVFENLPDQGNWTRHDLELRLAEDWFDADSFLVAYDDDSGKMVGFHWMKVHGDNHEVAHSHNQIGEIYVLGVDPSVGGKHLGRSLAILGMQHLKRMGLAEIMLYVDSDNTGAVSMYDDLGFRKFDTDTLYLSQRVHPDRTNSHRLGRLARR